MLTLGADRSVFASNASMLVMEKRLKTAVMFFCFMVEVRADSQLVSPGWSTVTECVLGSQAS